MASHLRCLLFHENGDFRGRVLVRIGGLYKTYNAVNGRESVLEKYRKSCYGIVMGNQRAKMAC